MMLNHHLKLVVNDFTFPFDLSAAFVGNQTMKRTIVYLPEIRKLYSLCLAKLTLSQKITQLDFSGNMLSAEDCITLYTKFGMFDAALSLAKQFGIDMTGIFESLGVKCVLLGKAISMNKYFIIIFVSNFHSIDVYQKKIVSCLKKYLRNGKGLYLILHGIYLNCI